jgi:uncharacterized membrane protein YdjX (TVP38/TMEM64 family)
MHSPDGSVVPDAHRRRASSLYGLIIGGAVLATSGVEERLMFIALSLVTTLAVYWVAETYVHVMAERGVEGHELSRRTALTIAQDGLPLISVSAVPLGVLLVCALAGMSSVKAADWALYANTLVLLVAGYRISRDAGLSGARLGVSVFISGLLGLAMVGLKIALNH